MNQFTEKKWRHVAPVLTSSLFVLSIVLVLVTPAYAQQVGCAASPAALGSAYITVNADQAFVNVRAGPNSYLYEKPGILYPGESATALGLSAGGDWIQISCFGISGNIGWVYATNVKLTASVTLPVISPPVSPTPLVTSTFDPTLAAVFSAQATSTRLPTFTPAPPPSLPVFTDLLPEKENEIQGQLILGLSIFGILLLLYSFVSRR